MELLKCPFCGREPSFSGDDCIACDCGASVNAYGKSQIGDQGYIASIWNDRSLNVEPQILKLAKIPELQSAYTDLCSAQWKINKRTNNA